MQKAPLVLVLSLALSACSAPPPIIPDEPGKGAMNALGEYPSGPYGFTQGARIENLSLVGRRDANANGSPLDDAIVSIQLADYYRNKDVQVLVVLTAAEWCGPCKAEQPFLVKEWNAYESDPATKGKVAMLEAIVQNNAGQPSDMTVVDRWTKTYKLPFDVAADPTVALGPYYNTSAFPMQMVLRKKDMSIVWQNNGLANDALKAEIDGVLANP